LLLFFVPVSIQEITTMDGQRVSTRNSTRHHGIVLTYRWNRTRNIYELYRHRRGENQPPLLVSEDWDMRLYNRDVPLIFHEQNFNNFRQHYRRETLEELRLKKECQTLYVPFVLKSFRLGQKEFNCPAHVVMFTTKIALWGGWIVPTLAPCVVGLSLKDFIWILIPCNHDFHAFTQNLHYKDLNIWS